MRHDTPFPRTNNPLLSYLKDAWENGLLDKYPDDHIIIQSIEDRLDNLDYLSQLINHNANAPYTPLKSDGEIDYHLFAENFIINLSVKLGALKGKFPDKKFDSFISEQLSASTKSGVFSVDSFLQALSEIEVLCFLAGADWDEYIYENPIGSNGANPEATFVKNIDGKDVRVNVEVKTPEFKKIIDTPHKILPAYLLSKEGRQKYQEMCSKMKLEFIPPRVTKLSEFLESATKKFNDYGENEINLLFINWTYSDIKVGGFLEAWSLLANDLNGLLNHPEIAKALPFSTKITDDTFKKVSAVIVYTSSLDEMMFTDFSHVFIPQPYVEHHFRMYINDTNPNSINLIKMITQMNPDLDTYPRIFPIEPILLESEEDMSLYFLRDSMMYNISSTALN